MTRQLDTEFQFSRRPPRDNLPARPCSSIANGVPPRMEPTESSTSSSSTVDRSEEEDLLLLGPSSSQRFVWISLPFEWFGRIGRLFMSYGTIPSKEQLQACGGQCPICHDNFNSPVLLECNHIFCELCVGTWFDREQTCPLCRAKIVDDPSYRDGATTFFLQLY